MRCSLHWSRVSILLVLACTSGESRRSSRVRWRPLKSIFFGGNYWMIDSWVGWVTAARDSRGCSTVVLGLVPVRRYAYTCCLPRAWSLSWLSASRREAPVWVKRSELALAVEKIRFVFLDENVSPEESSPQFLLTNINYLTCKIWGDNFSGGPNLLNMLWAYYIPTRLCVVWTGRKMHSKRPVYFKG